MAKKFFRSNEKSTDVSIHSDKNKNATIPLKLIIEREHTNEKARSVTKLISILYRPRRTRKLILSLRSPHFPKSRSLTHPDCYKKNESERRKPGKRFRSLYNRLRFVIPSIFALRNPNMKIFCVSKQRNSGWKSTENSHCFFFFPNTVIFVGIRWPREFFISIQDGKTKKKFNF